MNPDWTFSVDLDPDQDVCRRLADQTPLFQYHVQPDHPPPPPKPQHHKQKEINNTFCFKTFLSTDIYYTV